jgi:lipopolysaccharide/colanic/teichoic acid biosynthesis glycosyltransferase
MDRELSAPPARSASPAAARRSLGMQAATVQRDGAALLPSAQAGRPPHPTEAILRVLDLSLAALLLLVLSPLMALIALAVKLDSPGPVLFRQRRVGRALTPFTINKFRTMHSGVAHDAHREFVLDLIAGGGPDRPADDGQAAPLFKMTEDERVTSIGAFLRRASLDELPQLWNVLRGEMSLVGPRPPIPYEVEHYPLHWFARFAVKPGLTGLWQVRGRSQLTLEQMIALDIEYVQRRSLALNLAILLRTLPVVLSRRGAS